MDCVGMNTGAGTFLVGAQKIFNVVSHYHNFLLGQKTCAISHSIPTTMCSVDYSEIPSCSADALFANAEEWIDCQAAIKYGLANEIPIMMLDVRSEFWLKYESLFDELARFAFERGYRTAYVLYSTMSFDTGFYEGRLAFVTYQKKHNFNVAVPELPKKTRNIHTYLKDHLQTKIFSIYPHSENYSPSACYELEYDEQICIPKIKNGRSLKDVAKRQFSMLPGSARGFLEQKVLQNPQYCDLFRVHWGMKLSHSDIKSWRYIHPEYDRLFTVGEYMAINDWKDCPRGRYPLEQMSYGTPRVIGEWLALQAKYYLTNAWKLKDYSMSYDRKTQKFKGYTVNPLRPKKYINLLDYYNMKFDRSDPTKFEQPKVTSEFDQFFEF